MSATATVTLTSPIQTKDRGPINEVTIRRPKVRDMRAAKKGGGGDDDQEIRLVANLCELHPGDFDDMDVQDYLAIQEVLKGFFGGSAQTA